jgi:hypothetical protein
LISKMATDESITERTTVQGSAGILHREIPMDGEQEQQRGPVQVLDNRKFIQPYPSHLDFPGVLIAGGYTSGEDRAIDLPLKDRSESNGDRTASELEELRTDMLGQLSNIGESWGEANDDDGWLQPDDAAEEKKALARTVSDARSWGHEALRKIREFRNKSTAWKRQNDSASSQRQERKGGTDAEATHVATVSKTGARSKQKQSQLRNPTTTAQPDRVQTTNPDVAEGVRMRLILRDGQNTQLNEKLKFSEVEEIPQWISPDGPIRGTRTRGVPGLGSAVTRLPHIGTTHRT